MNKILFIAMLVPTILMAQEQTAPAETKNEFTISLFTAFSEPSQFGISIEREAKENDRGFNSSYILNLSAGTMDIDAFRTFTGTGFVISSGTRTYGAKGKRNAWYSENFLEYGNIKFDQEMILGVTDQYIGTYSYFSMFNPNIGYKWNVGKFSIDPSVGFNWKWEIRGKGDVDNKDTDNFVLRAGIKVGYRF